MTYALWGYVFGIFGVHWAMLSRVLELLVVWQDWFSKRSVDDHLSCVSDSGNLTKFSNSISFAWNSIITIL